MPTGNLPSEGKKLWEKVYNEAKAGSCKDSKDIEKCAAGSAWKAVKNAGWSKDADGKWHKALHEFSLTIRKAVVDPETGERRWRADISNTQSDLANDSMTLELFKSFISRIESKAEVPEQYRSEFWSGGIPYISVSHYPDLNGYAVPGKVDSVYIDGSYLKAKGTFDKTPLGDACWKSICDDQERIKNGDVIDDKVRISIAFLDFKHRHKSSGTITGKDEICWECVREAITDEYGGREFLDGHLIHFALTRVPQNTDTTIDPDIEEVEKSMTTKKEDAESIVGEELANEIDEKAKMVGKSEATNLVIKNEETEPEIVEETEVPEDVVQDINPFDQLRAELEAIKALVIPKDEGPAEEKAEVDEPDVDVVMTHPLDAAFAEFKSQFDVAYSQDVAIEQKLSFLQEPFEVFASVIRSSIEPQVIEPVESSPEDSLVRAFSKALEPLYEKMDMLLSQPMVAANRVPPRRSLNPETIKSQQPQKKIDSIEAYSRRSVGLQS